MGSRSKIISSEQRNANLKLQATGSFKGALSPQGHKNTCTRTESSAKAHSQTRLLSFRTTSSETALSLSCRNNSCPQRKKNDHTEKSRLWYLWSRPNDRTFKGLRSSIYLRRSRRQIVWCRGRSEKKLAQACIFLRMTSTCLQDQGGVGHNR
jgi:hypothetical protein